MGRLNHPIVKKAHIVPRCLLKPFASNGHVAVAVDGILLSGTVPIDDAATRRYFYRRHRPDGSPIDDAEWSLSLIEDQAAPLIAALPEIWDDLDLEAKSKLAEFFAIQYVRGPRWKAWWEDQTRAAVDKWRREPEPILQNGLWIPMTQRTVNEFEDHALTDTQWLFRMLGLSKKVMGIFGSMKWTLLEFDGPCLALSDHPVVDWPIVTEFRRPEPSRVGVGALNFLEVRIPVSPSHALLMTWSDQPGLTSKRAASNHLAANLNAFSIANAERQWVKQPGSTIPISTGYLDPVAPVIDPDYGRESAEASLIRKAVAENIQPKLGVDDESGQVDIFTSGARPEFASPDP